MLARLDYGDWEEVFKYAKPEHACDKCDNKEHRIGGPEPTICSTVDTSPFKREDVDLIIAIVDGMNDESDWVGVFLLKDGRYASIRAGCDYTGWG